MDGITPPPMERRLQDRFVKLVKSHMRQALPTAAGLTAVWEPDAGSFATTQAAWRFLNNDRVTLQALAQPLQEAGRAGLMRSTAAVGLAIYDWSMLAFGEHTSKADRLQRSHAKDVGYDLTTALLVDAADGSPLAPMLMHLRSASQLYSTEPSPPPADTPHVDQVLPAMQASDGWGLDKPLVHVIDREADSVGHMRQWDRARRMFLTRADDRCVQWRGREQMMGKVVAKLLKQGAFIKAREVEYQGKTAFQHVAEAKVTLCRPAKRRVKKGRKTVQVTVPGEPLELRLVVSRVCDGKGKLLATWLLLTNVEASLADAATVALWYYWRWRIESFFKLLKGHGQQVEQWRQETGGAIVRRLLVASMACVCVWRLQQREDKPAQQMKQLLVRLSGRQTKRKRPHTAPALLAGLFVLLPMLALLEEYDGDLSDLQDLAYKTLPLLNTG